MPAVLCHKQGGAIMLEKPSCTFTLNNSLLMGNAVVRGGGALALSALSSGIPLYISNSNFSSNLASAVLWGSNQMLSLCVPCSS